MTRSFKAARARIAGMTLVAAAAATLVACGGGGSSTAQERDDSAAPASDRSVALSATSDVAAILPAGSAGGAGTVLMRNATTGAVDSAVFVLADGTLVHASLDGEGRIARVVIDGATIELGNYTDTAVTVTYLPAGSGTATTETVDRRTGAVVAAGASRRSALGAAPREGRVVALASDAGSGDQQSDDAIDSFANAWDLAKSFLPQVLQRKAEALERKYEEAAAAIEKLKAEVDRIDLALGNGMSCRALGVADCAKAAYGQATQFVKEVLQVDPQSQTSAGFDVTANGVTPRREEWDPLAISQQIDTSFTMTDVPCEQSVFADMNPACPQYVAPQPPTTETPPPTDTPPGSETPSDPPPTEALAAHDAMMVTNAGTPLSAALYHSGAEFFVIKTQPAHGTLTLTSESAGTYVYTPAAAYSGTDSFTFVVGRMTSDGPQYSTPGVVSIEVKAAAVPLCEKKVFDGSYSYRCTDYIEDFSGSMATSAGFTRQESPVPGIKVVPDINNNQFYLQFESGAPWAFFTRKVDLDAKGRIVRLEERRAQYTLGSANPEADLGDTLRTVEEIGYDGATPVSPLKPSVTSYKRTVVTCNGTTAKTRVYLVPLSATPSETSESSDLSLCETPEKLKSFAASYMAGGAMTADYVMGSQAYQMSLTGGN